MLLVSRRRGGLHLPELLDAWHCLSGLEADLRDLLVHVLEDRGHIPQIYCIIHPFSEAFKPRLIASHSFTIPL